MPPKEVLVRRVRIGGLARPVRHKEKGMKMSKDYRSAVTGRYVKESYANSHPKSTVSEKRSSPNGGGGKGKGGKRK